jgi:methyltransferase (TIGR00027 family)
VDHPSTQEWKRSRLNEAGIAIPDSVAYVPVDLERQSAASGLASAGFDLTRPAFITWLGVTPYLTEAAVLETLRFAAGLASGSELIFDYINGAPGGDGSLERAEVALAARVAKVGEPFRSAFRPEALAAELGRLGFAAVEDLGPEVLNLRYFAGRADGLRLVGRGHLVRAR